MACLSALGRLERKVAPTIKILRMENQIVFPVSTSTTLLSHSTFLLQASLIQPPIIYINAYPRSQFPSPFVRTPRVNFHGLTRSLLSSFSMPQIIRIVSRYVYYFLCLKIKWYPCPVRPSDLESEVCDSWSFGLTELLAKSLKLAKRPSNR